MTRLTLLFCTLMVPGWVFTQCEDLIVEIPYLYYLDSLKECATAADDEYLLLAHDLMQSELNGDIDASWQLYKKIAIAHSDRRSFENLTVAYALSRIITYRDLLGEMLLMLLSSVELDSPLNDRIIEVVSNVVAGEVLRTRENSDRLLRELSGSENDKLEYAKAAIALSSFINKDNLPSIANDESGFAGLRNNRLAMFWYGATMLKYNYLKTQTYDFRALDEVRSNYQLKGINPETDYMLGRFERFDFESQGKLFESYEKAREIVFQQHGRSMTLDNLLQKIDTVDVLHYVGDILDFAKAGLLYSTVAKHDSFVLHAHSIYRGIVKRTVNGNLKRLHASQLSARVKDRDEINRWLLIGNYLHKKGHGQEYVTDVLPYLDAVNSLRLYKQLIYDKHDFNIDQSDPLAQIDAWLKTLNHSDINTATVDFVHYADSIKHKRKLAISRSEELIFDLTHTLTKSLDSIASEITDNNGLFSVYSSNRILYTTLTLPDTVILRNISAVSPTVRKLGGRVSRLVKEAPQGTNQDTLTGDLRALYQYLFADLEDDLPDTLHIVANGYLSDVPFAALRVDTTGQAPRYFGMEHTLSRQFGMQVYDMLSRQPSRAKYRQPFALSPDFGNDYAVATAFREVDVELNPLTFNQREVASIAGLGDGKYLMGEAATATDYYEYADDYGIIHLATHAAANLSNGMESRIFLLNEEDEPVSITAEEVSQQRLNADLVTLSACETGSGGRHFLEGTVGLTKSYLMAGSRSVVSTLWVVDDKFTSDIMSDFYAELHGGAPIHAALQTAQRNHLRRFADSEYTHPRYWAAFVPYGSMQTPAWEDDPFPWWWVVGGGALLVLGVVGYRRVAA